MEAEAHCTFPKHVTVNRVQIPLFKYEELASLGRVTISQRAQNYRDLIDKTGSRFFDAHRHLSLRVHSPEDVIARWFIDVQIAITNAVGYQLTHADFGAPADEGLTPRGFASQFGPPGGFTPPPPPASTPCWAQPEPKAHANPAMRRQEPCWSHAQGQRSQAKPTFAQRDEPCWSQQDLENRQEQVIVARREDPCWSQQSLPAQARQQPPPSYGGWSGDEDMYSEEPQFQKRAHPQQDSLGSRFREGASNAQRGQTSTIAFG